MDEVSRAEREAVGNTNRRVERVRFQIDRHLIMGDMTLPPAGYQSRFSDALNRDEIEFVPLTDVEITALEDGKVTAVAFLSLSKRHIRFAHPAEEG